MSGNTLCFYLGKQCRYGEDAPEEEQMDCQTCPVYAMYLEAHGVHQKEEDPEVDL